ncbi:MAG TPA: acyl-CoA thioester hydrolase/BAAT C-terminal domain-containing protein [Pseudonocardiaceae bacterium]|nr:acyl-CoA thioester hydrolase/BAAT C-terminal domain-containing protein [Pseudonocardiaceae bacterium]
MTESPDGVLIIPDESPRAAMLVLSGSSGRIATERVRLLAAHGIAAFAPRWFAGPGQPPGICELPLESFTPMLDRLAELSPRLGIIGLSKGAEAALLLAARDSRINVVVGLAPTHVVWANVGAGVDGNDRPERSSWTEAGRPLPFIPYDNNWSPPSEERPIAYRTMYAQSLRNFADRIPEATIPVERIEGEVLLAAGGDDQLWPSAVFAELIVRRRAEHGLPTTFVTVPEAGHRAILPGEGQVTGGQPLARGGNPKADVELGALVWAELLAAFDT